MPDPPSSGPETVPAPPRGPREPEVGSLGSPHDAGAADERVFLELRRKVQESGLLSAATERLLWKMRFNGRLAVVIHNGRIVKSAYEEGYFRRRDDLGGP